jgi:lysophospholipase L1-like esterase
MAYRALRELDPDWVISMDGVNDARGLAAGEDSRTNAERDWAAHPIFRFPFREARFLMRNSAAMFLAGEYLFFKTNVIRNARNTRQDPQVLRTWLARVPSLAPAQGSAAVERARAEFLVNIRLFDEEIRHDGRKHLLLVQPHVSLREPAAVTGVERAVFNYYMHGSAGRPDAFMSSVYQRSVGARIESEDVVYMDAVHDWPGWVFVDYCHFSKEANRRIAQALATHILTDGRERAF